MKIKFFSFPRAGDTVTIRTWPKTIQRKLLYMRDFEVLDTAGQRLAAATSAWLIINATTHRMASPKAVNLDLPAASDHIGLDERLDRIGLAQNGKEVSLLVNPVAQEAGLWALEGLNRSNSTRAFEALLRWQV